MAHFAHINGDKCSNVIVISNDDCDNLPFPESEPVGQAYIAALGLEGTWKQTSYNGNFRGRYAGIGYTYDAINDEFIGPDDATSDEFIAPEIEAV